MKLALIGLGAVNQGLLQILRDKQAELRDQYGFAPRIVAASTRTRGTLVHPDGLDAAALLDAVRAGSLSTYKGPVTSRDWNSARVAREVEADVLIEASPTDLRTAEPALSLCLAAFASGKHVVLANKGPIAVAYDQLLSAARAARRELRYEATVMGGTPSIRLAQQALAGCRIHEIRGILNGTTNYILTKMENGLAYADALSEAQALGYAEADPSGDVDGWDAAGKAIILGAVLFGKRFTLNDLHVHGIRGITRENISTARAEGERWKLIARVSPDGGSVQPVRLHDSDPLANVTGVQNAITYVTDLLGDLTLIGPGAGGLQTGFGLLSDLLDLWRK